MPKIDFRSNPPLDSFILLDSSILLSLFTPVREASGNINHSLYGMHYDVLNFLNYVVPQVTYGSVLLIALDLAIEECAHHIVTKGIERDLRAGGFTREQERYRRQQAQRGNNNPTALDSSHKLYKFDAKVMKPYMRIVDDFIAAVRALPVALLAPADLQGVTTQLPEQMADLMKRYNLLAADAYQLAVAQSIGISMVATTDRDWLRAQDDFSVLINR